MQQVSIYRNGIKFANVPVSKHGFIQNVTQVPSDVMDIIRNWCRGVGTSQKQGQWSWEWQQKGSKHG